MSTRQRTFRARTALLAIAAAALIAACGGSNATHQTITATHQTRLSNAVPGRLFAPTSVWNAPLPASTPIDPQSRQLVQTLTSQVSAEEHADNGPWIATSQSGVPIVTVGATQADVSVALDHPADAALTRAWRAVPLPSTAAPAQGTDGYLVLWQPSTNRMWEFWRLQRLDGSWHAAWGGAIRDVSDNPGVYGSGAWPGAKPYWGVTATSLALAGGTMTISELERGQINHALALSIPTVRSGVFASPAERTDGSDHSPTAIPEGARLRLDPHLNLNAIQMPRLTRLMAEAAQRYGIVIRDYAGIVSFSAQDPEPGTANPYAGAQGIFQGMYPSQLLASFPWSHLQVVRMQLHRESA
jgi:hypothetical protein